MKKENLVKLVTSEEFREFLVEAKREGYADESAEIIKPYSGGKAFRFGEGKFKYADVYYGSNSFIGSERVFYEEKPIWGMNYSGEILLIVSSLGILGISSSEIYSFLKKALGNVKVEEPLRGPLLEENGWFYVSMVEKGDIANFEGREFIRYKERDVYKGRFHGGIILD